MRKYITGVAAIAMIVTIAILYLFQNQNHLFVSEHFQIKEIDTLVKVPEIPKLYGITLDSLEVYEGTIAKNQFLGDILSEFNVSFTVLDNISRNFKEVFDVRKLAVNKKYAVLFNPDSSKTAAYFVYEPNEIEYVVFNLQDSINVEKFQRKLDTIQNEMAGVIDYSLYNTMMEQGVSPLLVNKLADVYAWQIDFFRIQQGDRFKVIYEEIKVEDKTVGIGKILAAYFEHYEMPYYAFYYDQGSGIDYFDEEGNSLRKAFLKAPLNYSRISSGYSNSRLHPVLKIRRPHHGIDYAAPTGTPVLAVGDGTVIKRSYSGGAGNMVKIKHNSVYTTAYLHLSKFASGISVGSRVKQGQVIGYVGSTGLSTGPHLDFRYWKNGSPINPLSVEPPPSEPIKEEHKTAYMQFCSQLQSTLDQINFPKKEGVLYANTK
ncbi:MAG: M23 family metallopeptidase [Cyclobacteriaceae bacterium]